MDDSRLILTAAPFGTITAGDATATVGKFAGFLVTTAVVGLVILDKDSNDVTLQVTKVGDELGVGAYHTPRKTAEYFSSVIHDGTGEITLVHANAIY